MLYWLECLAEDMRDRKHLRANGRHQTLADAPRAYCEYLQHLILTNYIAPNMVNKDFFRNTNPKVIACEVCDYIETNTRIKAIRLPNYYDALPQNRVACWGAAFDSWLQFFEEHIEKPVAKKNKIIFESEFQTIPKRYRSALRRQGHVYIVPNKKTEKTKLTLRFKNATAQKQFEKLHKEAKELLRVVYDEYAINVGNLSGCTPLFGARPSDKPKSQQRLVLDEQIIAINRLKHIFETCINLFWFIKTKSNAGDVITEYNAAKQNKDMLLKAQRYLRTVKQVEISAQKNADALGKSCVQQAEENYNNSRVMLLNTLEEKLRTRKY